MMAAVSLLLSKSHASISYGNLNPDHIGKGILGNAVLVAKLTQQKHHSDEVRNTRQKLSAELNYGHTTKLTYLNTPLKYTAYYLPDTLLSTLLI